jgi:hypothetical protein
LRGSYSQANVRLRPVVYKEIPNKTMQTFSVAIKEMRRFVIVNCWNLSECESAALWKLYLKSDEGVAVQSTFNRLKQCFGSKASEPIFIGKVKYIDYKREWLPEGNFMYPFVHKRKSFEHEQELRALIMKFPESIGNGTNFKTAPDVFDRGEYVDVDLGVLVENVYVSPTTQDWFKNLVESIMNKYGLSKSPVRSDLDAAPVY